MSLQPTHHVSVMLPEVLEFAEQAFADSDNHAVLDCTLGGAGHAQALLELDARVSLLGLDRDEAALGRAKVKLAKFESKLRLMHTNFSDIGEQLDSEEQFGFILADLGLSSDQLDDPSRGFSFRSAAALDMRLDQSSGITAADIVNTYEESQLAYILKQGGVRNGTRQIAQAIVSARPLESTAQLEAVVTPVVERLRHRSGKGGGSHPATVVFQALRMAVNDELNSLKKFLNSSIELVAENGMIAVISFHSGEDKLVAQMMRRWSRGPEIARDVSLREHPRGRGVLLTKKAIFPSESEQNNNPRARSARLRVFQRGTVQ